MSNENKSVKSVAVAAVKRDGPGRPRKEPKWPNGKFTRALVFARNGSKMTPLTVQKHLNWDMYVHAKDAKGQELGFPEVDKSKLRKNSLMVKLTETRAPKGEKGLGRRQEVYALRSWLAENPEALTPKTAKGKGKTSKALKVAKTSTVTVPVMDVTPPVVDATSPETAAYEATKAALTAPAPVAETAPETAAPVAA